MKRIILSSMLIFVCMLLLVGCGNSRPKSVNEFIANYNKEIKKVAKQRNIESKYLIIYDGNQPNEVLKGGTFAMGNATWMGVENNTDTVLSFNIDANSVGSDNTFAIIEAAILASGGDIEKVMKGLGVQSKQTYYIPAEYFKEYQLDKNLSYDIGNDSTTGIITFEAQAHR